MSTKVWTKCIYWEQECICFLGGSSQVLHREGVLEIISKKRCKTSSFSQFSWVRNMKATPLLIQITLHVDRSLMYFQNKQLGRAVTSHRPVLALGFESMSTCRQHLISPPAGARFNRNKATTTMIIWSSMGGVTCSQQVIKSSSPWADCTDGTRYTRIKSIAVDRTIISMIWTPRFRLEPVILRAYQTFHDISLLDLHACV